jgi:hypothetical protein
MGTTAVTTRRLSLRQSNGRIANTVATLLRKKLTVPEIYLRPRVPGVTGVDVMAVDHAGSGDIHGVEILFGQNAPNASELASLFARLKAMPLHFKYFAVPESIVDVPTVYEAFSGVRAFDAQGLGRIGLICYTASLIEGDVPALSDGTATLLIKPERFLLRGEKLETMERFIAKAKPDISVRI